MDTQSKLQLAYMLAPLCTFFGIAFSDFLNERFLLHLGKAAPKPFGCGYCMAFWIGMFSSFYFGLGVIGIFTGCLAAILTIVVTKHLEK